MAIKITGTDSVQQNTYWVIAVVRFKDRVTFDKKTLKSISGVRSTEEMGAPLVIKNAVGLNIASSRGSHIVSMSVALPPTRNYITDVFPGDWVGAWIVDGKDNYDALLSRLEDGADVSSPEYGLKFIGKVQTVTSSMSVAPQGTVSTEYQLSAAGFTEFDTSLFYMSDIARTLSVPQMLRFLGIGLREILTGNVDVKNGNKPNHNIKANTVSPIKMVSALLSCIFGIKGPFANAARFQTGAGELSESPSRPYVVPQTVLGWFGESGQGFEEILWLMLGLQHYNKNPKTLEDLMPINISPAVNDYQNSYVFGDLLGDFSLVSPPLNNVSVWNLLTNYVGAPVNDMFVAMRPVRIGNEIKIRPVLVLRQNPFSSDADLKTQDGKPIEVTRFSELPRWEIGRDMVRQMTIVRSNAARLNFSTVLASPELTPQNQGKQIVLNLPVQDDVDIERHGVRPYMPTVNAMVLDYNDGPRAWKALMADIVIGEHHTLSGTMTTAGVYAPVSVGDNLQFANVVYHIESVSHICSLSPGGQKQFQTTFGLSHGMVANQNGSDSTKQYPGLIERSEEHSNVTAE